MKILSPSFGTALLHELSAHRIEQYKRDRLAGRWRAWQETLREAGEPSTVNREPDALRAILSWAVKEGKLIGTPMKAVERLRVDGQSSNPRAHTVRATTTVGGVSPSATVRSPRRTHADHGRAHQGVPRIEVVRSA